MKIRTTILISLIISTVTCVLAAFCVYRSVEKLRFKLLPEPTRASAEGTASLRYINLRPADARILAIRINNDSDRNQAFKVRQNGIGISEWTISGNSTGKHLFLIPETAKCSHCKLVIVGQNADWQLQTVEIRNVLGFSSVWLNAVLTESSFRNYTKLKPLELALLFLITFLISMRLSSVNCSRTLFIPAAFALLLLTIIVAMPYVSNYRVLISITAFIKLWLLSFLPVWIATYRAIRERQKFKPVLVSVIVALMFTGGMLALLDGYDGNFSGFLQISKKFLSRNEILHEHPEIRRELIKVDGNGYDAQFYYFIAFDPLLRHYHISPNPSERPIDAPAFRYHRIVYPVLAKLFALNNPFHYPAAMVFLLIAGTAVCGFFLSKIALSNSLSGWDGLTCVLIPAFWFSITVATPEPLAAAFLTAGFFLALKDRFLSAAILFSFAILTRESAALFLIILAALEFRKPKGLKPALILLLSFIPYIVWRGYIGITLFNLDGWKGFLKEPATLGLPFAGVIESFRQIANNTYVDSNRISAVVFPILLIMLLAVCGYIYKRTKNPAALIGVVYTFFALSLSHGKVWVHVANVERLTYESFLCLGFLLVTRSKDRRSNIALYASLVAISIYDLFIMILSDVFQSGLLWLLKC